MSGNENLSGRARAALPGGVSHELRYRTPHPIFIERAAGAEAPDQAAIDEASTDEPEGTEDAATTDDPATAGGDDAGDPAGARVQR